MLELKYTDAPPWWMADLARRLGRHRMGYSKYVTAVTASAAGPLSSYDGREALA